jgi:hypothetical protein
MRKGRRSRACYLVLYLLLVQGVLLADDSGNSPAQVLLQRTTLTVSDADRSIRFYRGLLGFTVSSDSSYDTTALRAMFNIPPGSTPRLVLLEGLSLTTFVDKSVCRILNL